MFPSAQDLCLQLPPPTPFSCLVNSYTSPIPAQLSFPQESPHLLPSSPKPRQAPLLYVFLEPCSFPSKHSLHLHASVPCSPPHECFLPACLSCCTGLPRKDTESVLHPAQRLAPRMYPIHTHLFKECLANPPKGPWSSLSNDISRMSGWRLVYNPCSLHPTPILHCPASPCCLKFCREDPQPTPVPPGTPASLTSTLILNIPLKATLHEVNSTFAFVGCFVFFFFLSTISTLLCLDIIISFLGLDPTLWQCLKSRKISVRGQSGFRQKSPPVGHTHWPEHVSPPSL